MVIQHLLRRCRLGCFFFWFLVPFQELFGPVGLVGPHGFKNHPKKSKSQQLLVPPTARRVWPSAVGQRSDRKASRSTPTGKNKNVGFWKKKQMGKTQKNGVFSPWKPDCSLKQRLNMFFLFLILPGNVAGNPNEVETI